MTQKTADGSTVEFSGSGSLASLSPDNSSVPALTVLYHPDLHRIGERTLLPEIPVRGEALLDRHRPEFSAPGELTSRPLDDPYISRQPLRIRKAEEGGLELLTAGSRTRVAAQGGPLDRRRFPAGEVESGVVLLLSGRVVLLLHRLEPPPRRLPPRFGLIGDSAGLVRVRADVERMSEFELPVLLRGETGTGKELAARALHDSSPRRSAGFFAVNLSAVPPTLSAVELFGAIRGAYTGAQGHQEGWFRRAHGGTLFLDEIGEVPPEVQVLLLRVLETGEIYPVGSQVPHRVDVRIVAATDADLEQKVRGGTFRAPLLHRLAGYEIRLPPLRERRDDVGRLLLAFLRRELAAVREEHRLDPEATGCDPGWLPPQVVSRLAAYDWPGNVRQLQNVVRQLVIGSRGLPRLEIGPQVARLLAEGSRAEGEDPARTAATPPARAPRRKPGQVTEEELLAGLKACRWEPKAAAELLRLSRTSLYARIAGCARVRTVTALGPEEIARCHRECGGDLDAMVERLEVSKRALGRRLREMRLA